MSRIATSLLAATAACATPRGQPAGSIQVRTAGTTCAGHATTDTTVYGVSQLAEQPELRTVPPAHYSVLPAPGTELRASASFIVNADGHVDSASVRLVDSTGSQFDRDAVQYVRHMTYWPGCRDGVAVRARAFFPIDYRNVTPPE